MNREQKIALIIGFAVILVVGILVSDHLSAAQQVRLADATEGDTGRVETRPVASLPDPDTGPAERYAAGPVEPWELPGSPEAASAGTQASLAPVPGFVPAEEPRAEPLRITLGGNNSLGEALERASSREASAQAGSGEAPAGTSFRERVAEGLRNGLPAAAQVESERPETRQAGRGGGEGQGTVREVPERRVVRHTVAKDESLYKIAAEYLGNGNRWREIAEANKGRVGSDGSVRSGVTLEIPGAAGPAPTRPTRAPSGEFGVPAPQRKSATSYTVAKNDSLGEIAQRLLGSVKYMDEIIRANPGKISDPDDIRVGMVLTIPSRS